MPGLSKLPLGHRLLRLIAGPFQRFFVFSVFFALSIIFSFFFVSCGCVYSVPATSPASYRQLMQPDSTPLTDRTKAKDNVSCIRTQVLSPATPPRSLRNLRHSGANTSAHQVRVMNSNQRIMSLLRLGKSPFSDSLISTSGWVGS